MQFCLHVQAGCIIVSASEERGLVMKDAVLFDLDGTLTDSGEGIMKSVKYAFEQMKVPAPDEEHLRLFVGPPLAVTFPQFGIPADQTDEAIRQYRIDYNEHGSKFLNQVYPGIPELLSELQNEGYQLYVATSKPEVLAKEIMDRFDLSRYFIRIAGASLDHSRESKTDVLRYLLQQTGSSGREVMVGDTLSDIRGAHAIDIPCIAVSWGYGAEETLGEAERIARTMEELKNLLETRAWARVSR